MNKYCATFVLLFLYVFIAGSFNASGENRFYIDDFNIPESAIGKTIEIPVKAKFDTYVSAIDISITFPKEIGFQCYKGRDSYVTCLIESGEIDGFGNPILEEVTQAPAIIYDEISDQTLHFTATMWDFGWVNSSWCYGGVKWAPGTYDEMFILRLRVDPYFFQSENKDIVIHSETACAFDTRFSQQELTPGSRVVGSLPYYFNAWSPTLLGDAAGKDMVGVEGVTHILNYIVGCDFSGDYFYSDAADVVYDKQIDIVDAVALLDFIYWDFGRTIIDDPDVYYDQAERTKWVHEHSGIIPFPFSGDLVFPDGYYLKGYRKYVSDHTSHIYLGESTIVGDLNGDLEVNISDLNLLINALLDKYMMRNYYDLNGDGEVNISDINVLIDLFFITEQKTPSPIISYSIDDKCVIIEATGEGTVHLYRNDSIVENPVTINRENEDVDYTFTATAQKDGEKRSDPSTLQLIVPRLMERPEITPSPIISYALNEDNMTIYAFGEGDVKLFINSEEETEYGFVKNVENPYRIPLTNEPQFLDVVYATAQEEGKYMGKQSELWSIEVPSITYVPSPDDIYNLGYLWLVVKNKNDEDIWHIVWNTGDWYNNLDKYRVTVSFPNVEGSEFEGMQYVPIHFVFTGSYRLGASTEMQEIQYGNDVQNDLIEDSEFDFCLPAGYTYAIEIDDDYGWSFHCMQVGAIE